MTFGEMMPTEKEKMLRSELYNAADPQLVSERRRARDLLRQLNATLETTPAGRQALLAELFGAVGDNVELQPPFFCDYGRNITLGDNVYFNFNCSILDPAPVRIGNDVMFGPNVQIYTATHPLGHNKRRIGLEAGRPITIGDDVWVGGGAIICPGVTIGAGSAIGAGSVVTTDIPPGALAVGNPCRPIRAIDPHQD